MRYRYGNGIYLIHLAMLYNKFEPKFHETETDIVI